MPKAALPTTPKGWAVTLLAALTGFIAGFVVIATLGKRA